MKKLISILIVVSILFSFTNCLADTNFSEMTYDELLSLEKSIVKEIMSRPEWKKVEVPAGDWVVGEDIPAGSYSIIIPTGSSCVIHLWGAAIDDYDTNGGMRLSDYRDTDIGKIELFDGNILQLSKPIYLAPPKSLGF